MLTIMHATIEMSSKNADTIISKFLCHPNSIETMVGAGRINSSNLTQYKYQWIWVERKKHKGELYNFI